MKLTPFYRDEKETKAKPVRMLTLEESKQKAADEADFRVMKNYRKDSGWEDQAVRGMKIYNVVQTAKPDDQVSRIMIGYTRTQIDKGIEQMSSGQPDFDFEVERTTDKKQHYIWKSLMDKVLIDCQYKVQQDLFFRDYFTMGCGVFEVYTDYPQRTIRIPSDKGFIEKVVRDRRKPRVGLRALNPLACWRNSTINDTTSVPSCVKRTILTWDSFVEQKARSFLPDGTPRYKNIDMVEKAPYVIIYTYQNEQTDGYREYAKGFGDDVTGLPINIEDEDMGIPIEDKPLKIHNIQINNMLERSFGVNIQGTCTLRWGTFFDVYDSGNASYGGNHSVYGVGLPRRIEGEDMVLQTMFNQHLDNERWANSYALNYKGNSADSYMDVDANRLYGGEFIDGEITPMPLGISRSGTFENMMATLNNFVIPATGINHQQITGDTSKTAYEFSQRIKQANASAEQRLERLESELFEPVGQMLFSSAITELTVEEWEDITPEEYSKIVEAAKNGKATISDIQKTGKRGALKMKRRVHDYLKIKSIGLVEKFDPKSIKTRKIDPYSVGKSSLVIDPDMIGQDTFIPITAEYVYPIDLIETGILPRVKVTSKRMMKDMKAQQSQEFFSMFDRLMLLSQAGWQGLDLDKTASIIMDFADQPENTLLKDVADGSEDQARKAVLDQMNSIISPEQNVQNAQTLPMQTPTGGLSAIGGGQPQSPSNLEKVSQGLI